MSNTPLAIIILAAGKGTRMKSDKPKVMHELAGRPMINWLLDSCEKLNPQKIITVIGPDMDDLANAVKPHETALQETRDGTAGAVKCALPGLKDFDGKVLILMGDEPLVEVNVLQNLIETQGLAVQGFQTASPSGLGRMVLNDDGSLKEIVEDKDCTPEQKKITLCNAGNYCIPAAKLTNWLGQIDNNNTQGEYYLTDIPAIAAKDGVKTHVVYDNWSGPWGVNDRIQLAAHEKMLQSRLREKAMAEGVAMIDPETVYFHHDTTIASGVSIEPNVFFGPKVSIAKNTTIKAFSHIEDSTIGENTTIGPFARLRGGSKLAENTKVGNFVELKNAEVKKGAKASHLTYLGDAMIGENSNIGAGTITCNYNGFEKSMTEIGENVFVGSNAALVAPIKIEDGSIVAAGSTVTEDVPADALFISRPQNHIKQGWAKEYKAVKSAAKKAVMIAACLSFATPAIACEGFKNAMSALETTLEQHKPTTKQSSLPHLNSLNKDLTELEKRVRAQRYIRHMHAQKDMTPKQYAKTL